MRAAAAALAVAAAALCAACGNRAPLHDRPAPPAEAVIHAGLHHLTDGDLDRAEDCFRRGLAASSARDHREGRAVCLYNLGIVHRQAGELEEALGELQLAEEIFRAIEDREGTARALTAQATVLRLKGLPGEARRRFEKALSAAPDGVSAEVLASLAMLHLESGDSAAALSLAEEAVDRSRSEVALADSLFNLGRVYLEIGDYRRSRNALQRALELDRAHGRRRQLAGTLSLLGLVAARRGDASEARDYHLRAATVWESLGADDRARASREAAGEATSR